MKSSFSEIMNIKVPAGSRTLYVDLKQNSDGSRFLSIREVRATGVHDPSRILVDEEFVGDLHRALGDVLEALGRKNPVQSQTIHQKGCDHPRAYQPWTKKEQEQLKQGYAQGKGVRQLAELLGRAPSAVLKRLYQVGVIEEGDEPCWD